MNWTFGSVWNQSLESSKKDRPLDPREHIWASEIGGSMIDRYLKMKGTPPTNPPNPRSRRKFEAGNIWESIVGYVLKRAGILIEAQERLEYQYPGLLKVSGKLDFVAGGNPDYDKALAVLEEFSWLPSFVSYATSKIVEDLKIKHPNGLKNVILEIKSCSSFMFEIYEKKGTGSPQHRCQNFHYLKSKKMDEGHIVYVSRDDARILEVPVFNPSLVEDDYLKDIVEMTAYVKNGIQPDPEKPLVFDETLGKFSANWKVAYSNYLTMLYGFENQMQFDEKYKGTAERWNRVLGRIEDGKELTDNNKAAIDEMEETGFDIELIKKSIQKETT